MLNVRRFPGFRCWQGRRRRAAAGRDISVAIRQAIAACHDAGGGSVVIPRGRWLAVGENHLRPQFIQFNRCQNVLIEDVKIRNSPFWTIHLLLCADETGGTPFKIAGDARLPVQDVFLENITLQKAHGQAKSYKNAENIHESGVSIVELVADEKIGK